MEVITKGDGKYYDVPSYAVLTSTFEQVAYDILGTQNYYTSTNSPYAENYEKLINGQDINGESFKTLSQYINRNNSAVIPGIVQTNMGDETVCKNMVSQGVCI